MSAEQHSQLWSTLLFIFPYHHWSQFPNVQYNWFFALIYAVTQVPTLQSSSWKNLVPSSIFKPRRILNRNLSLASIDRFFIPLGVILRFFWLNLNLFYSNETVISIDLLYPVSYTRKKVEDKMNEKIIDTNKSVVSYSLFKHMPIYSINLFWRPMIN